MCAMLVTTTVLASLIQGAAAATCLSSADIASAYQTEVVKVSMPCLQAMGSACNGPSAPSCGVDMTYTMVMTCTGANCKYMPASQLEPRTITQPQTSICVPAECQNAADGSIIMGAMNMSVLSGVACSLANSSSNTTGMQMDTKIGSWETLSLTCNGKVVASKTAPKTQMAAKKLDTCLDVKKEFQMQGCCGNPTKTFDMGDKGTQSGGRRLSQDTVVEDVRLMLENAKMQGGAENAGGMAADLIRFVEQAAQEKIAQRAA